jgi:hypothetical protein
MIADCGTQIQTVATGTTKIIFQLQCTNCDSVALEWEAPDFPEEE